MGQLDEYGAAVYKHSHRGLSFKSLTRSNVPLVSLQPRSPDFIGIGAQKAGTYWLRLNLARHPGVWMPPVPELHFFDRSLPGSSFPPASARQRAMNEAWRTQALDALQSHVALGEWSMAHWSALANFFDHDDAWYRLLFAWAPPEALVGEITPRYAICGDAEIAHMHALAPEAKLLFLLRNPIDRFWSQCLMKQSFGTLKPDDPSAMRLFESANGRPRGEYSKTILRYCHHFDPARILIVFMEGIQLKPAAVLHDIHSFLGLTPVPSDPTELARPINSATNPAPMPASLRARITAAYRSELEILAEVFGGPAIAWLEGHTVHTSTGSVLPLTTTHVAALRRRHRAPLGVRPGRGDPMFCISMQRSGTTTVGDWLESHGLIRAGFPTSSQLGWTMHWLRGEFDEIFTSPEFQAAEILEDDPWWCPDFYKVLADRFPTARFILLSRDVDEWFDSLCHHSGGFNPGPSMAHAKIYRREHHIQALMEANSHLDPMAPGLLSILEHESHYKSIYLQHNQAVRDFFAPLPGRLFSGQLDAPETLIELCDFAGVKHNPSIPIPHSNARTAEMALRLTRARDAKLSP